MVDVFMRDLEEAATIAVDHADLIVVAARAGEDDAPTVNAGGIGERGICGRREGCVCWWEGGFDGQPDRGRNCVLRGFRNEKKGHGEKPQEEYPKGESFFLFLREDFFAVF